MARTSRKQQIRALHEALDGLAANNSLVGFAVEHRGIDMIVTFKGGKTPWYAYAEREEENTNERKFIEADGGVTVEAALDVCADAVEAYEDDRSRDDEDRDPLTTFNRPTRKPKLIDLKGSAQ